MRTSIILSIILTTDVVAKLIKNIFFIYPLAVSPPNNTALLSETDVKVKLSTGGSLSPATLGEVHLPAQVVVHSIFTELKM